MNRATDRLIAFALVVLTSLSMSGACLADAVTVVGTGPVVTVSGGVSVPVTMELTYWVREAPWNVQDPYGPGSRDVVDHRMDFGQLNWDDTNKIFTSNTYFTVFLIGKGYPYKITQTCTGIVGQSNPANNLNYSVTMVPDYQDSDCWNESDPSTAQGPMSGFAAKGSPSLAVGANKLIYNSAVDMSVGGGSPAIVRCYYGIWTDDPSPTTPNIPNAKVVTGDQAADKYQGSILFSLVAL